MRFELILLLLLVGCSNLELNGPFEVKYVIDGDTVRLNSGEKIRFSGIDTPEITKKECFSLEAKEKLKELLENNLIYLEEDINDTDTYGRFLRYVYTDIAINELLVKEGYAKVPSRYKKTVKYYSKLKKLETYARSNCLGLWSCEECFITKYEEKDYFNLILKGFVILFILLLSLISYTHVCV